MMLKIRFQPDGITCGPTCLAMISKWRDEESSMTIKQLSAMLGTNSETGTTGLDFFRVLNLMRFSFVHRSGMVSSAEVENTIRTLNDEPSSMVPRHPGDRVMLCRTLSNGCKHWYIATEVFDNRVEIFDPSRGRTYIPMSLFLEELAARNNEHFVIWKPKKIKVFNDDERRRETLFLKGWTVSKRSLYDEEGVEGYEWEGPNGGSFVVIGDWNEPPPPPDEETYDHL